MFGAPLVHEDSPRRAVHAARGMQHAIRDLAQSLKDSLNQKIVPGERALYYVIHQYLAHYQTKRNYQGLDNRLIVPETRLGCQTEHMVRPERLGRLPSYPHREAA